MNVSWRGAIEFAGFPVNVALYQRVKKQRNESFRNLAPSGQPVKSKSFDPVTDEEVSSDLIRKGVQIKGGKAPEFAVMTVEALEQIKNGVKTVVASANQFVPVSELDLSLAIDRFAVRPDDKVAGADQSVNIIWNGLRSRDLAYVSQMSLSGGHDGVLVLYPDATGLWGVMLPFEDELYEVPEYEFTEDDKAASLFGQVVDQQYADLMKPWVHGEFESEYRSRRAAAIDAVIAGEDVEVTTAPEAKANVPDLLSALAAAVKSDTSDEKSVGAVV